ncbi:MAG: aldehyde ferredoxin oxidoreductase family protein [Chloroflexota bacterium]|nr:aldehyde ferredoxin oxidoreductase family protein [Chloroflexota bacterium]
MAGFQGRMLEVDLTKGSVTNSIIDKEIIRKFIGGSGLGAKLMFDRIDPKVDPLSPENPLFILTGPTSGLSVPGGARFSICAKSPLTNIFGESSSGGNFATEIRQAGWDGIIVSGASDKPVYLVVEDDKAEIKDASDLWGKNTQEITDILKERHGGKKQVKVISIGVAGEKLVRFACVCNEKRDFAGRCGLGAVMGSKKLKAVVVRGSGKIPLADQDKFNELRKEALNKAKESIVAQVLGAQGTNAALGISALIGDLPGKNWTVGDNTAISSKIDGGVLSGPPYYLGNDSCHGCMVGCKRHVTIPEGPYQGMEGEGPEYEGAAMLGSLLMIGDMAAVIKMNDMCNMHGMDVISCGGTIAMAMDCFERGIITAAEMDGIELKWGDDAAVVKMIENIVNREGFGDVLAEGSKRAAEKIGKGASDFAVEVKGMEVPAHDPRANYLLGLGYATGTRGACHTSDPSYSIGTGIFAWADIGIPSGIDVKKNEGAAEMVKHGQDLGSIYNSMAICYMVVETLNGESISGMLNATTGFDYNFKELEECGERIWHMKRGLSNLMGITSADDRLPRQLLTPNTDGGAAGCAPDLELMLKEYYPVRGLAEDGRPTKETLDRLGLDELKAKLYK